MKNFFYLTYIAFFVSWFVLIFIDYYSIRYSGFDTGIYAQQVSNLLYHGTLKNTLTGKVALANHFTPNIFLLSPFFLIFDSFLILPIFRLIAFFICPIILLYISKEILPKENNSIYVVPIMWIFSKFIGKILLFEFQVSTLSPPFILLAFLFIIKKRYSLLLCTMLFLLGFKEHLCLVWISLGAYFYLYENKKKLGAGIVFLGVLIGALIYFIVMPSFSDASELSHISRFGPFELLKDKFMLLFMGLVSVGFLPLFCPKSLFIILPVYSLSLISNSELMISYKFHYQDIGLTVLYFSSILGLRRIMLFDSWLQKFQIFSAINIKNKRLVVVFAIFIIAFNNSYPFLKIKKYWPSKDQLSLVNEVEIFSKSIDKNQVIVTLDSLAPYFFRQKQLYSFKSLDFLKNMPANSTIVFADGVNTWPFSSNDYKLLSNKISLDSSYKKHDNSFSHLKVFLDKKLE